MLCVRTMLVCDVCTVNSYNTPDACWGLLCRGKAAVNQLFVAKNKSCVKKPFLLLCTKAVTSWNVQSSSLPCYLYRAAGASFSSWTG